MSQISILGFTPLSHPDSSSPSVHWSILLSPADDAPTSAKKPKTKSRTTARFFHQQHSSKTVSGSTLFDMQNHQLRQQAFPIPVAEAPEDSESDSDSHSTMSTNTASIYPRTTTTISSSLPDKPLHLRLRIKLCTHPSAPHKLAPKLSTLLYGTPTYGPEDDWLHAALEEIIYSGMLESSRPPILNVLDADAILHFAQEVAKQSLSEGAEHQVHEFDYEAHLQRNAALRAMFGHATPSPSGSRPTSVRHSSHKSSSKDGTHRFLGFRISPSPSYLQPHRQDQCVSERRYYGRRDDPYAGLM